MWEFLTALFGGISFATKASLDKMGHQRADLQFKERQKRLKDFRTAVTKPEIVDQVRKAMSLTESRDIVADELAQVFSAIHGLKGKEDCWMKHNRNPAAGNWGLVELILCIRRGCVPLDKQFYANISPYYIGNDIVGVPRYATLSATDCNTFAMWASNTLKSHGVMVKLVYKPNLGPLTFVWEPE